MEQSSSLGSLQSAHPWLSCLLFYCPQAKGIFVLGQFPHSLE